MIPSSRFLRLPRTALIPFLLTVALISQVKGEISFTPPSEPIRPKAGGSSVVDVSLDQYFHFESSNYLHFDTVEGPILVQLYDDAAVETTVENFRIYVDAGAYDDSIIHLSVPGVLQGGGYRQAQPGSAYVLDLVPQLAGAIPIEYQYPNQRGTISMARTGPPDYRATSSWFFNTQNNTERFGPGGVSENDPGYAVFGRVVSGHRESLITLNALDAVPGRRVTQLQEIDGEEKEVEIFSHFPWFGEDDAFAPENFLWIHSVAPTLLYQFSDSDDPWTSFGPDGAARMTINQDTLRLDFQEIEEGVDAIVVYARDGRGNVLEASIPIEHTAAEQNRFPGSLPAAPYWWSQWLGFYWADHWPHVYVLGIGWAYVIESSDNSYWFFHYRGGSWLWVHPGYYPYVYRFSEHNPGWINIVSGEPAG